MKYCKRLHRFVLYCHKKTDNSKKKHSAVDDGRATGANDNKLNKLKHSCIPLKKGSNHQC